MSSTDGGPRMVVSSGDHEAFIVLSAGTCLAWTLLVFLVRLYLRLRLNGPFGADDTAASIATAILQAIAVAQTSVTFSAVHDGIGEKMALLTPSQVDKALKSLYAASILYIAAICAAKCSMFLLIARLTRNKSFTFTCLVSTVLTVMWGIAALFVVAFQCRLPTPWNTTTQHACPHLFARWVAIEASSLAIEGLVCALAIWLVWNLQMSIQLKVAVVGAFLMRILIVLPAAFKLALLRRDLPSPDSTFDTTKVVIATQVTMHYTIMAATFPCMRAFLQAFNSGLGATTGLTTAAVYDSAAYATGSKGSRFGRSKSDATAYALESVDRDRDKEVDSAGRKRDSFRPEDYGQMAGTTTIVTSAGSDLHSHHRPQKSERKRQSIGRQIWSSSEESLQSEQPIITKKLEWEVRHETRDLGE